MQTDCLSIKPRNVQISEKPSKMFGTFNMGVGLVVVVDKTIVNKVIEQINNLDNKAFVLGEIIANNETKIILN